VKLRTVERIPERLRLLLAGLALILAALTGLGCSVNPKPPGPVPTPTPPPSAGPVNPEMLLHADVQVLKHADGSPFDFRGAVACCNTEAGEPNPKWPLASTEWMDYIKAQGNIDVFHIRLGPWRAVEGGETEWKDTGGAYLEVGGKTDLSQFNPKFWAAIDSILTQAASKNQWVEVDLIDGWGIKHCQWGDQPGYHPWQANQNLQDADHCKPAFDSVQEAFVRKAAQVVARHGNAWVEVSNEGGLVSAWNEPWENQIIATFHDEESKQGYPRHVVSSNSERVVTGADLNEFHTGGGTHPITPKVTGVNEYNPDPPLNGQQLSDNYCSARSSGVYYFAWRHSMTSAEWVKGLGQIKSGCTAVGCSITTDPVPLIASKGDATHPPVCCRPGSGPQIDARNAFTDEAEAAVAAAHPEMFNPNGSLKGWPSDGSKQSAAAQPYFNLLVEYFRSKGACASAWEDSVAWGWKGDGFFEEWHLLHFADGHPIDGRHAWQYTWQFPK